MIHTDQYRIERVLQTGQELLAALEEHAITPEKVLHDTHTQWMVTTPLTNIGEQVYCISKDFKESHPHIQWSAIAGLRHRLVHDYDGVSWKFIAEVLFEDLQVFLDQLQAINL